LDGNSAAKSAGAGLGRVRMPMSEQSFGLILAGGLSRRMGGGDKTLREVGGVPMLAKVIEVLRPQCAGLLISANGDHARFARFALPLVLDTLPGFAGPLAGILAGLDWLHHEQPAVSWLVSAAGDTPFLPADLVQRLHEARVGAGADLACASSGGRLHPVIGLWPVNLRQQLRHFLVAEGERKVGLFMKRHRFALADWPVEPHDPFFNANYPEDMEVAERISQLGSGV
jgi:molybdopterin-guanine dinucleotide biosynthesis protein A